jgi:uncharacterized protein (DUF2236 family)
MTIVPERPVRGRPERPATGRPRVAAEPFGPGSLLWDLAGDHRVNLVFLMPTLMQAMHPVIGDALRRIPVTTTDPWGRRTRSLDSIQLWVYGGPAALAEGRRLLDLHKPVRGRDTDGRDRSALSPDLWAWVVLSGYPGFLTQCRVFGEPLGPAGERRLYAEMQNLARILGVRERHIPPTVAEFWDYYAEMVGTRLTDHPHVHRVLAVARRPMPPPGLPGPLAPLWRALAPAIGRPAVWLVHGTFPPEVRRILGVPWSDRDERLFRLTGQVIRRVAKITPEPLRYARLARQARGLARARAAGRPADRWERRLARTEAAMQARQTRSVTPAPPTGPAPGRLAG